MDVFAIPRPKPTAPPSNDGSDVSIGPGNEVFPAVWWLLDGRAVGLGGVCDLRASIRWN